MIGFSHDPCFICKDRFSALQNLMLNPTAKWDIFLIGI
jgi:hypothetical protein